MKKVLSILLTVVMLLSTLSVFSVLSVSAATANIGDGEGKAADKPAGSGTQNDPYLISSVANLNWIRDELHNGSKYEFYKYDESDPRYYGSNGTFAGVYFEQTCDIDLGGGNFTSIGGYRYDKDVKDAEYMDADGDASNGNEAIKKSDDYNYHDAFSGIYNGNGYRIYNGTIKQYGGQGNNTNWACGLFGMIYGATIKNVVLDNINFNTNTLIFGGVVGIAWAPLTGEDTGTTDYNVIENCVVKSTCTLTHNPGISAGNMGSIEQRGSMGGVVGMAWATTIRGCVNEMNMTVSGLCGTAGGVVGAVEACVIEYCVNKGSLTVGTTKTGNGTESSFGGVVGYVAGATYASGSYSQNNQGYYPIWTDNNQGVTIRNCYNAATASFSYTWQASTGTMYWGGILGAFSQMRIPAGGTKTDLYLIENCYNLYGYAPTYNSSVGNTMRVAGLLGLIYTNGANYHPVVVRNSSSVAVSENSTYNKNNQIVWHNNVKNNNLLTQTNVTEQTANAMADTISALDKTIAKMHARGTDKVTAVGYQEALDNTTYRVVLGINSTRWFAIGAEVSLTLNGNAAPKTADKSNDTVYNGVQGKVDGQTKTWMASDLYVGYLSTLDITGVAEEGTSVYTIRTYVKDQDASHTKIYGDVIVVTFEDGVFQNAVVNPTA